MWLPLTILAAAVALILVAVLPRLGKQSTVNSAGLGTSSCGSAFPGHQGQQGGVTVRSVASAGGTRLAVGGAGGHPAIWRCSSGSWQLVPAGAVPALQGSGELSSVAHGPDGWIAVGDAGSGAAPQPVAVTSANGESWQPVNSRDRVHRPRRLRHRGRGRSAWLRGRGQARQREQGVRGHVAVR